MECQECITTYCKDLKKPTGDKFIDEFYNTYCCYHANYDLYDMCEECHVDYISTEADRLQDMYEDHILHTEFDN